MTAQFVMRAYSTSYPVGWVYWAVLGTPDMTGSQAGFPQSQLTEIGIEYELFVAIGQGGGIIVPPVPVIEVPIPGPPGPPGASGAPGATGPTGPPGPSGTGTGASGTYNCPSSLTVASAVYLTDAYTVGAAMANSINTMPVLGFVTSKPTSTTCTVLYQGEIPISVMGWTDMAGEGETYYASTSVAGGIQKMAPVSTGQIVQSLGFMKDNAVFVIQINPNIVAL